MQRNALNSLSKGGGGGRNILGVDIVGVVRLPGWDKETKSELIFEEVGFIGKEQICYRLFLL